MVVVDQTATVQANGNQMSALIVIKNCAMTH